MGDEILICKNNLRFSKALNSKDRDKIKEMGKGVFLFEGAYIFADDYGWVDKDKLISSLQDMAHYMKKVSFQRQDIRGEILGFVKDGNDHYSVRIYVRNGRAIEDEVPVHWRQYYPRK